MGPLCLGPRCGSFLKGKSNVDRPLGVDVPRRQAVDDDGRVDGPQRLHGVEELLASKRADVVRGRVREHALVDGAHLQIAQEAVQRLLRVEVLGLSVVHPSVDDVAVGLDQEAPARLKAHAHLLAEGHVLAGDGADVEAVRRVLKPLQQGGLLRRIERDGDAPRG